MMCTVFLYLDMLFLSRKSNPGGCMFEIKVCFNDTLHMYLYTLHLTDEKHLLKSQKTLSRLSWLFIFTVHYMFPIYQAICNLINTNHAEVLSMLTVNGVHDPVIDCQRILLLNYIMEQLQQLSFLKLVEAFLKVLILRREG